MMVVIHIEGGIVQGVYADEGPYTNILVLDSDVDRNAADYTSDKFGNCKVYDPGAITIDENLVYDLADHFHGE